MLRFGYMPSFNSDILDEIEFAKKHFDFIEITLLDSVVRKRNQLEKIKNALGGFEIIGHLHWEFDLTSDNGASEIKKILQNINAYRFLGAGKITIHPSSNFNLLANEVLKRNVKSLEKIAKICKEKSITLMVENSTLNPFDELAGFKYLFEQIKTLQFSLDIGHAKVKSINQWQKFVKAFKDRIRHIHLHDTNNGQDHLPFSNKKELGEIISFLANLDKNLSITLEIFPEAEKDRRKIILMELSEIKNRLHH